MATSLARQLQALRSDVVGTLDKRKHQRAASLLFDPDEAAAQTFAAVYALGINGLHGLIQLEPRFGKFARTLFAESAKEIDRAIQASLLYTKAENDDIDESVVEFLDLLAPHVLAREAMKALEWLIRRFKIHQFAVTAETLLFTFLPHHREAAYTRLIQIISLPPHFAFLSQYTDPKSAQSLPPVPLALFTRNLARDPVLLETYQNYVLTRAKQHALPALATHKYLVLTGETIIAMRQARVPEETIVSRIMPFVAAGLRIRGAPEVQIACYSVLAILGSKRTLEGRVLDAAMEAVVLGWGDESLRSGILCVSSLAYFKEDGRIPVPVKKAIVAVKGLIGHIEAMPSQASTSRFIVSLIEYIISLPNAEERKQLVADLVTSGKLASADRQELIQNAIQKALNGNKTVSNWIGGFSEAHPDKLKSVIEPLLGNFEAKQVTKLEELTKLELMPTEMMEIEYPYPTISATMTVDPWSLIPSELTNPSFFASPTEYAIISEIYSVAVTTSNRSNIEKLFSSPLFLNSPLSLPTFLARTWITLSHSTSVRSAALTHFADVISPDTTHDLQGFLPHILVALSTAEKPIREAACTVLTQLHRVYSSNTKHSIIGLMEMYAEDVASLNTLKWLSIPEVKWFLTHVLLPKLAECKLDAGYIHKVVGEILNQAGKKGKKEQYPSPGLTSWLTLVRNSMSLMVFLASHVACSGMFSLQYYLLRILTGAFVDNPAAIKLRAQCLETFLEQCNDTEFITELLGQVSMIDPSDFKGELVRIVGSGSGASQITILLDLVRGHGPLAMDACRQLSIVFPATGQATQLSIARLLISQFDAASPDLAKCASSTLDAIALPTPVILSLLDDVKINFDSRDMSPARKRQRTESSASAATAAPEGVLHSIRRLVSLLEALERQSPERHSEITTPLFAALDGLIAVESDTRTSFNYAKQLILSCLISIVKSMDTTTSIDVSAFRIDSLISCIRTSANPQVHNRTLILLSELARFAPDLILNHVMPLFTFMGSSVLRQDDDYTSLVIEQTIKSVVPMLTVGQTTSNLDINPIIAAFVNNFDFIPKHRRLSLFRVLLETVGADEYLATTLFLLAEKCCQGKERSKAGNAEFGADLLKSFSLSTRLTAMDSFLRLIMFIPRDPHEIVESLPVELKTHSVGNLISLKRECLQVVALELQSQSFQANVARVVVAEDNSNESFSSIAEKLLLVRVDSDAIGRLVDTSLDGLLSSLSLPFVITIVENFVRTNRDSSITSKMIPIATVRLVRTHTSDTGCKMALSKLLPLLTDIIKANVDTDTMNVAFASIAKLSRVHGKAQVGQFEDILPVLVENGILSSREQVVHFAIDCLSVMMLVLDARILPFLPDIMTVVMNLLARGDNLLPADFQISVIRFVTCLYRRIPSFMTSYLPEVFCLVLSAYAKDDDRPDVIESRGVLLRSIPEKLPTEVCLESLSECWLTVPHKRKTLTMFAETLGWIVAEGDRNDWTSSSKIFFDLFLKLFGIRGEIDIKPKAIKNLEKQVTASFLKLVTKLNDATFRPFFITLRDWAFRSTEGDLRTRLYKYHTSSNEAEIKTVVTSYYGLILDDTIALLDEFENGKATSKDLWISIIQSLKQSFVQDFDQDSYWSSPSRFEKIIHPLLRQLPLRHKSKPLIDAVAALAAKAQSEDNSKIINTILMEYMKSESASVRLEALRMQKVLFEELTLEWLKVLPPMVPVISELMEDEDEAIVEATHNLIAMIESVGGISMQKLLI